MKTDKKISAAKRVLKQLQNSNLPLYKLCHKYDIYETEFRSIINRLNMGDVLKAAMAKRKSKVFSIAKKNGTMPVVRNKQQQKIENTSKQAMNDFKQQEKVKTRQKYQCCGCGQHYEAEPVICIKCQSLSFEIVNIPVRTA